MKSILKIALSSFLYTISFQEHFGFCAFFCLIPIFSFLNYQRILISAASAGFVFGALSVLGLSSWIIEPFGELDGISQSQMAFPLLFACCYMGLHCSVLFVGLHVLRKIEQGYSEVFLVPSCWVVSEYLRSEMFGGIPWGFLGHTQIDFLEFVQIAEFGGVYIISWLVVAINVVLWRLKPKTRLLNRLYPESAMAVLFVVSIGYGFLKINEKIPLSTWRTGGVSVAILQGSVGKDDFKAGPSRSIPYFQVTAMAMLEDPDLIIVPEVIIDGEYEETVFSKLPVNKNKSSPKMIVGSIMPITNSDKVSNVVFYISDSKVIGRYDKIKLVPFGEFWPDTIPRSWFDISGNMTYYQAGTGIEVFQINSNKFSVMICFDALFPEIARRNVEEGAELFVSVANEAWTTSSFQRRQYQNMIRFRAIESGRYLVRSSNNGISSVIDPFGKVVSQLEIDKKNYKVSNVQYRKGKTMYILLGEWFVVICIAFISLALLKYFFTLSGGTNR